MFTQRPWRISQMMIKVLVLAALSLQWGRVGAQDFSHKSLVGQVFRKYDAQVAYRDLEMMIYHEQLTHALVIEAMKEFQQGHLHKFDPSGGDTCCQVRAHQALEYYHDKTFRTQKLPEIVQNLEKNLEELNQMKGKLAVLLSDKNSSKEAIKKKAEIKKLFERFGNEQKLGTQVVSVVETLFANYGVRPLNLPDKARTLALSYFVTKFNSESPDILAAKRKYLMAFYAHHYPEISKGSLEKLLQGARLQLNVDMNIHVEQVAKRVVNESCNEDNGILYQEQESLKSLQILLQDLGETALFKSHSTYAGFLFILRDLWLSDIPILVKSTMLCPEHGLHKVEYFYVKNPKTLEFEMFEGNPEELMKKAVMVLEGVTNLGPDIGAVVTMELLQQVEDQNRQSGFVGTETCALVAAWEKKLKQESLSDVALANLAKHPQYVDKNKSINFSVLKEPQKELQRKKFEQYCEKGTTQGMCMENMSFLRLIHVFPALAYMVTGKVKFDMDRETKKQIENDMGELASKAEVPTKGQGNAEPERTKKKSSTKERGLVQLEARTKTKSNVHPHQEPDPNSGPGSSQGPELQQEFDRQQDKGPPFR